MRAKPLIITLCAGATFTALAALAGESPSPKDIAPSVSYGRDIRPLLSDRCFTCHGPDAAARKADLRLDLAEEATRSRKSGTPIVPGDPEASEVWKRLTTHDADDVMPPKESEKPLLSERERELVKRWIEQGAVYERHWAFVPPVRPAAPEGEANAIDGFIAARLQQEGLELSAEAPRETLARRVYLDLTGLPPEPAELDAFLADTDPKAYENLVDTLLTKEPYRTRYAERMATPWLDQARYADTSGIHTDAGRSIWPWRDWVLKAYRDNMPFDRFVYEQLAGDLLPNATVEQKIATGFHRNHVTSDEGGAINEEYLVEYAVDRVSTTGSVFLGLTVGCARCHDHKYDPISMEEFYGLFAYFNSIREPGIYSQLPDDKRAFEPFLEVPTPEQSARIAEIDAKLAETDAALATPDPSETERMSEFFGSTREHAAVAWSTPRVVAASTSGGSTIATLDDQSVLVTGKNPDQDVYTLQLSTTAVNQQMIMLEVLTDPSMPDERPGRSGNGNAMLTGFHVTAAPADGSAAPVALPVTWAWADLEQTNGDYRVTSLLHPGPERGWALDGHNIKGRRTAVFMTAEPFGFASGTTLEVKLAFESPYARHGMGRVRVRLSPISPRGLDLAPTTVGSWHTVGPFPADRQEVFTRAFGPEETGAFDLDRTFQPGNRRWAFDSTIVEGVVKSLSDGTNATYVAHRVYSPTAREAQLLLGSDDGIRVFVNGAEGYSNNTERGATPDQDRASVQLRQGPNDVVFKVVNTGGAGGFAHRQVASEGSLAHALFAAVLPEDSVSESLGNRARVAWRTQHSESYRQLAAARTQLEDERKAIVAAIPRTMIMAELPEPRKTFILKRGLYDHPDLERPVSRGIPRALGALSEGAPSDRRGLAEWIVSRDNPLTARVTVNRIWAQFFGAGIVPTGEDFGLQGTFPTHPDLLDWLAVEFQDRHWDLRELVRTIVTSRTYRQSSVVNPRAKEQDPANALLAYHPRQRLSAEQIRDAALAASGLLVEKLGGPSVKPYQPAGLWEEVSMPASNTKAYAPGRADDLYRRSMYTYWKRASPPPSMQVFDAPTRESCVTGRLATNTPLQALVLWNDPQFIEAARVLASRVLASQSSDAERLTELYRRCTGRRPDAKRLEILAALLGQFRERYASAPEDAQKLTTIGESMVPAGLQRPELAAWTMVANAVMATDAFVTKD